MQTAYTVEQIAHLDANNIPQELKNLVRTKIQQVIIDIIDIKRIHHQSSWHNSDKDIIEDIIDDYATFDPNLNVKELKHCGTAACIAGHVELDLLDICNVREGKYAVDEDGDTFWFELNKELGKYETYGEYSPIVEQFAAYNNDEYITYGDGKPAFLVAKLGGLSESETNNIFDGDLTIANIAFSWNAICRKNGWDGTFANYLIPTEYLIKACQESYIYEESEITYHMGEIFYAYYIDYPEIFDEEGYLRKEHQIKA